MHDLGEQVFSAGARWRGLKEHLFKARTRSRTSDGEKPNEDHKGRKYEIFVHVLRMQKLNLERFSIQEQPYSYNSYHQVVFKLLSQLPSVHLSVNFSTPPSRGTRIS